MAELILDLIPLALGIVLSPLAIMALVAVLLSKRASVNGVMYLIGWALAAAAVLTLSYGLLGQLKPANSTGPPTWLSVLHVVVGAVMLVAGIWEYRQGRAVLRAMAAARTPAEVVAAAPQLPGWLTAVAGFTAARSLTLGFGLFALNPVDLSCALIAGIDIRAAQLDPTTSLAVVIAFGVVALIPIALPVALIMILGRRAEMFLSEARTWIASHNGFLNAGLLLVIGALQVQKGLSALLG